MIIAFSLTFLFGPNPVSRLPLVLEDSQNDQSIHLTSFPRFPLCSQDYDSMEGTIWQPLAASVQAPEAGRTCSDACWEHGDEVKEAMPTFPPLWHPWLKPLLRHHRNSTQNTRDEAAHSILGKREGKTLSHSLVSVVALLPPTVMFARPHALSSHPGQDSLLPPFLSQR